MLKFHERLSGWLSLRDQPPVPWNGLDVIAGLLFVLFCCPALGFWVLEASHFFQHYYDSNVIEIVRTKPADADLDLARARLGLWVNSLVVPLQVMGLQLLFFLKGYRPQLLGLTLRRFWLNLGLGVLAAGLLTPPVLGLNFLVTAVFSKWTTVHIEHHPLQKMAEQLQPLETAVLVFAVVVAAPLLEELLVRGLLQSWFASRPWGGHLAMTVALLLALQTRSDSITQALGKGNLAELCGELMPAFFVLALVPGYLVVWSQSRTPVGPALYGTALLFAAAHSNVWPTPVALFAFGLALCYLYQQTRSLVGPVVLHSLFNAVGCVMLLRR